MNVKKQFVASLSWLAGFERYAIKLAKGIILMGWIVVLSVSSWYALYFGIANIISKMSVNQIISSDAHSLEACRSSVGSRLHCFIVENDLNSRGSPPIESMLRAIGYENLKIDPQIKDVATPTSGSRRMTVEDDAYISLFSNVRDLLIAQALSPDKKDQKAIAYKEMVPKYFLNDHLVEMVDVPLDVKLWMSEYADRADADNKKIKLMDTFTILLVLGAFGSLIFLTKDYLLPNENAGLSSYIFRPILGMFLALAMFVLDLAAHSLLSSAPIQFVRNETLYLLAFAAGLLSEHAYGLLLKRAEEVLDDEEEKTRLNVADPKASQPES
ncbi:MAG: hypothetical protein AB3X41_00205 [Leptothrix ochracea]|uniref:hypothetical protein n=1 Tax=Leptothrix ochracea TaxID=735331 RepID=UPI0034E2DF81